MFPETGRVKKIFFLTRPQTFFGYFDQLWEITFFEGTKFFIYSCIQDANKIRRVKEMYSYALYRDQVSYVNKEKTSSK